MNFRPALAALSLTLALGACGEMPFGQSETAPEAPGHSGPPTVSPVDQPIETGGEGTAISTAEATTMNTAIFRAVGTEPFWAVTAGSDTAVYERPGQRSVGVSVRRITYGRGVEFIGVMNGRPFTLNLQAAACSDGMSDTKYPFTARLATGGQRLNGCAGPTDTMPKAQVRASSAPATTTRRATPAATRPATPAAETSATESAPTATTTGTTTAPETTSTTTTPPVTTPTTTNGAGSTGTTSGTATPSDNGTAGATGNATSGTSATGTNSGTSSTTTPSSGAASTTGSSTTGSSTSDSASTDNTATPGTSSSTSGASSTGASSTGGSSSGTTTPSTGTTVLPAPEDAAE